MVIREPISHIHTTLHTLINTRNPFNIFAHHRLVSRSLYSSSFGLWPSLLAIVSARHRPRASISKSKNTTPEIERKMSGKQWVPETMSEMWDRFRRSTGKYSSSQHDGWSVGGKSSPMSRLMKRGWKKKRGLKLKFNV